MEPKHLLTLRPYSSDEIKSLLTFAAAIKSEPEKYTSALTGKTLAMLFQKRSTRTRVSFEVGMLQLGGRPLFLSGDDLQLGRGETIGDTARVLSRYVDGIMARVYGHDSIEELAANATVPVINGLSDWSHPCQILADYQTIQELYGEDLTGRKLVYVGDANNVYRSLVFGGIKLGVHVAIAAPAEFQPDPSFIESVRDEAQRTGSRVEVFADPQEAVTGADVIYTDVWTSMGQEEEQEHRRKVFAPYQVNAKLMAVAGPQAKFMHCLPAHRGEEVTSEVADSPASVIFDQAENRLHAQKAVLVRLLGE
ncbi:MAG: ornithine carbamoyltransferase [Deltaproteobacteria bacterium]|nr:ornithine carbamoyltransferase [Deltaproteobacteria bacterium]